MEDKLVKINAVDPDPDILAQAARFILKGKVLVCPTDTGYALAANALDSKAIARVFALKGRSFNNPMHVAVSSLEEAEKYAVVNEAARMLAKHYLPGALTLVLPKRENVPAMLVAGGATIGIRIPANQIILKLAKMTGRPLTATSANTSGKPTPYTAGEVLASIGEGASDVAMILDQGQLKSREVSTIVDLCVNPPQLIRQGLVSWLEIREYLVSLSHSESS